MSAFYLNFIPEAIAKVPWENYSMPARPHSSRERILIYKFISHAQTCESRSQELKGLRFFYPI